MSGSVSVGGDGPELEPHLPPSDLRAADLPITSGSVIVGDDGPELEPELPPSDLRGDDLPISTRMENKPAVISHSKLVSLSSMQNDLDGDTVKNEVILGKPSRTGADVFYAPSDIESSLTMPAQIENEPANYQMNAMSSSSASSYLECDRNEPEICKQTDIKNNPTEYEPENYEINAILSSSASNYLEGDEHEAEICEQTDIENDPEVGAHDLSNTPSLFETDLEMLARIEDKARTFQMSIVGTRSSTPNDLECDNIRDEVEIGEQIMDIEKDPAVEDHCPSLLETGLEMPAHTEDAPTSSHMNVTNRSSMKNDWKYHDTDDDVEMDRQRDIDQDRYSDMSSITTSLGFEEDLPAGDFVQKSASNTYVIDFDPQGGFFSNFFNLNTTDRLAVGKPEDRIAMLALKLRNFRHLNKVGITIAAVFILSFITGLSVFLASANTSETFSPTISQSPTTSQYPSFRPTTAPTTSSRPSISANPSAFPTSSTNPSALPSWSPTRGPTYQPSAGVTDLSILVSQSGSSKNDVVVPAGTVALIDGDIDVGRIEVRGELRCHPGADHATLRTDGVVIKGKGAVFSCGSKSEPFKNTLVIELKGKRDFGMGDRAIGAKNGGVISLHGEKTKSQYVRLTKTMSKSSYTAMVDDPAKISGWKRGDKVVISTTSFYPDKNDYLTVKSIDSDGTITFTDRSKHKHYGDLQRFTNNANNQVYAVDQRAYVANLSRNIVIQGSTDSLKDEIGAHVIVLQGGEGYIDSVEFTRVGQKSKLGRYPFHWHRVGDVSGQYIKNSSIHGSFHRCITIHNSQRATVTGNTCYDFMGHGFFLEEGNEVNNVLQYNLGIYGRKILKGAVLASDNNMHPADRFPGPATFWISNPDNDIRYNAAVGCEGTGYWMSFRQSLKCGSKPGTGCVPASQGKSNVFPASTRTLFFSDNVAMATVTGFTWDGAPDGAAIKNNFNRDKTASGDFKLVGAHYRPTNQIPIISNLHMYKCAQTGIRVRGEQMHFPGAVFADVATGAFFSSNQVVRDSLFVGVSANHDTIEFTYHFDGSIDIARRHPSRYVGIRISDGPWVLENVHFANYGPTQMLYQYYQGQDMAPVPVAVVGAFARHMNIAKRITFNPEPQQRFDMAIDSDNDWQDSYGAGFVDIGGGFTGYPGRTVVPFTNKVDARLDMNYNPSCFILAKENALVCASEVAHIRFDSGERSPISFDIARSDGPTIDHAPGENGKNLNKFPVIINNGYTFQYIVSNLSYSNGGIKALFEGKFGSVSPIIQVQSLSNSSCAPHLLNFTGGTNMGSLQNLTNAYETAYAVENNSTFYFRMKATSIRPNIYAEAPQGTSSIFMSCE